MKYPKIGNSILFMCSDSMFSIVYDPIELVLGHLQKKRLVTLDTKWFWSHTLHVTVTSAVWLDMANFCLFGYFFSLWRKIYKASLLLGKFLCKFLFTAEHFLTMCINYLASFFWKTLANFCHIVLVLQLLFQLQLGSTFDLFELTIGY